MGQRYKFGLLFLAFMVAMAFAQKSSMSLEDKISNLQDMLYKRPIISMNMERWKNYVRSAPRNYSMIVMFTALSAGVNCPICKYV